MTEITPPCSLQQPLLTLDNRQQRQQDAGEFLECLLDQLAEVKAEDGRRLLQRTATTFADHAAGAVAKEQLNTALSALYKAADPGGRRRSEALALLHDFAEAEWQNSAASGPVQDPFLGPFLPPPLPLASL